MPINYLDNINVGDKIDLPDKEKKPQEYLSQLKDSMKEISKGHNECIGINYFDEDLKIITSQTEDIDFVKQREDEWSSLDKKDKERWSKDKERNTANITEMAITLLLDKYLGDRYIVARASTYDDYKNGADNILIDKVSGEIVCGMDGVIGHQGDDGGDVKEKKLKKIMAKGGAEIKYGASLDTNGKIISATCSNVPAFYLSLSKKDLLKLLDGYYSNKEDVLLELFNKLKDSINEQISSFKEMNLDDNLMTNLNKFKL